MEVSGQLNVPALGMNPRYPFHRRLGRWQSRSAGGGEERKHLCTCRELNPGRSVRSSVTIRVLTYLWKQNENQFKTVYLNIRIYSSLSCSNLPDKEHSEEPSGLHKTELIEQLTFYRLAKPFYNTELFYTHHTENRHSDNLPLNKTQWQYTIGTPVKGMSHVNMSGNFRNLSHGTFKWYRWRSTDRQKQEWEHMAYRFLFEMQWQLLLQWSLFTKYNNCW
jgi:hypothetical protein